LGQKRGGVEIIFDYKNGFLVHRDLFSILE
jgi:hypothetical protein